jgi:hypothetical protein
MKIDDGTGSGSQVKVTTDNRLDTSSRSNPRVYYVSRNDGQAYTWSSAFSTATGEETISIKNTSTTKNLYIDSIRVGSANAAVWTLFQVTSGTAAGTTLTATNLNLTSSNAADSASFGNASVTGSLAGPVLDYIRTAANGEQELSLSDALILGQNDEIAITYTGSTGLTETVIEGFFE